MSRPDGNPGSSPGGGAGTGPSPTHPPSRAAWLELREAVGRLAARCELDARARALRMVRRTT